MTNATQFLCSAVKKVISQLKPQANGFSFLLLTGKTGQGKKTLLRQSLFQQTSTEGENPTDLFYNEHGLIIDFTETWLHQNQADLQNTLKQLNRCHQHIRITGVILCVDTNELLVTDPLTLSNTIKAHCDVIHRISQGLEYRTNAAVILTKLDALAGFCEFYQQEHASELCNPLGFSLTDYQSRDKLDAVFKHQFNRFIETIGQQVLNKIHPTRSDIKRTLIREFPLQLASLRLALQSLITAISPKQICVQSIFFTSGEQRGFAIDRLHHKIQHEYALTIQEKLPLSNNYRAYFIQGALTTFQAQTKQYGLEPFPIPRKSAYTLAGCTAAAIALLTIYHLHTSHLLDNASKEWLAYDIAASQQHGEVSALYHLSNATASLEQIHSNLLPQAAIGTLETKLIQNRTQYLSNVFLPNMLREIELVITDNQQPHGNRYEALKIYLMLSDATHFDAKTIMAWFQHHWHQTGEKNNTATKLALLQQALRAALPAKLLNAQLINDTRNFLNAMPAGYLYYAIAKNQFSSEQTPLQVKGFTLANASIPYYYTKPGYHDVMTLLPQIAKQLTDERWVLNRDDSDNIAQVLTQTYHYDYVLWWKNFIKKTTLSHAQTYQEAIHLIQTLRQSNAIDKLVSLIQLQTSPETNASSSEFNQQIASQFTDLNLMTRSSMNQATMTLTEMERFLTTMSIVDDHGKTAFTVTKSRFQGDVLNNPVSQLFSQAEQLPEPIASWTKQLAGDTWFLLIGDTKKYINTQWQNTLYQDYLNTIANRYPFDMAQTDEVTLFNFNRFFGQHGELNTFVEQYVKPFLDTTEAQWKPKAINDYMIPFDTATLDEIIRANVITTMFFPGNADATHIDFSLQKSDLAPEVRHLTLTVGTSTINDGQDDNSFTRIQWPQSSARLSIELDDGKEYSLDEPGIWGIFRLLQKVTVQSDEQDSSKLEILFEIKGNSGRYILKTHNDINPFTPGILSGFNLPKSIA